MPSSSLLALRAADTINTSVDTFCTVCVIAEMFIYENLLTTCFPKEKDRPGRWSVLQNIPTTTYKSKQIGMLLVYTSCLLRW